MTRIALTGHRPDKLQGLDVDAFALAVFANHTPAGAHFDIGMAQGWDMAGARACVTLGLPFTAVIPFQGQQNRWPDMVRREYFRLLKEAQEIIVVSRVPCKQAYKDRNRHMVARSDAVWALWDGSTGGTGHCVNCAIANGLPVWDYWGSFLEWSQTHRQEVCHASAG